MSVSRVGGVVWKQTYKLTGILVLSARNQIHKKLDDINGVCTSAEIILNVCV